MDTGVKGKLSPKEVVNASIKEYTIVLKKSQAYYVSLCLELMVAGCGQTKEEAIESVRDAIYSYLDSYEEGMPLERPVPLDLLHEFLGEEDEKDEVEELPRLKVLTYG
ncbi:MAG: type II toxin-antitoxin system HicB family antitoxin [bacterium]